MRWKIEGFVFCDQQQSLAQGNNIQQLEPILVELLSYFCQHPDKILSRDELVDSVWLGRTVTDNAVNRAIAKLRRCFGDHPKAPKFIATFPKKGYKFIAQAEQYDIVQEKSAATLNGHETSSHGKAGNGRVTRIQLALMALVFIATALLISLQRHQPNRMMVASLTPVTSGAGQEWHPRISPDQQYLAYAEIIDSKMRLFVKRLSNGEITEISPEPDPQAWVGPASWSPDGNQLVYLAATENYCRYYRQPFHDMQPGPAELIYQCPAGSYGKIAFTHSNQHLIFAERATTSVPYELFSYDLTTNTKKRLSQPPLVRGGNMSFDLHPSKNKLLISSPNQQMREGFFSLDLDDNRLELLFDLDGYLCCGIWSHSGEDIIIMGDHPAQQLVRYDLQGNRKSIIYSGSQQLYAPTRHSNGKDFLFALGSRNINVNRMDKTSGDSKSLINSSKDDRLIAVSPDEKNIAYISTASGTEQIWWARIDGQQPRQLTRVEAQLHFRELRWSPNGTFLAAMTLNQIYLFDTRNNQLHKAAIPQMEIKNLSFKNSDQLAYSIKHDNSWRVMLYNIAAKTTQDFNDKWQFVSFTANESDTVWQDTENRIYTGASPKPVTHSWFRGRDFFASDYVNLVRFENAWYWQTWDFDQYELFRLADNNQQPELLLRTDSEHYALFSGGILYHVIEGQNTDIFQTRF